VAVRIDGSEILNPGLLIHQIIWQVKTVTGQDAFGAAIYTWTDFLRCKARVESTQGKEFTQVMQRWAEAEFSLTQHFSKRVTPDMRIAWLRDGQTVYLDVLNINDPAGIGRYQYVICRTFENANFTA